MPETGAEDALRSAFLATDAQLDAEEVGCTATVRIPPALSASASVDPSLTSYHLFQPHAYASSRCSHLSAPPTPASVFPAWNRVCSPLNPTLCVPWGAGDAVVAMRGACVVSGGQCGRRRCRHGTSVCPPAHGTRRRRRRRRRGCRAGASLPPSSHTSCVLQGGLHKERSVQKYAPCRRCPFLDTPAQPLCPFTLRSDAWGGM